ncbi:unnamed protein product [Pleuronectes platessa]|uniref:Uncharacterized protein n=1 Tax=Pleuronectes platessa TaxID=8262 RepID=A0A9N7W0F3_PLEPL|nr:unnamed protein product [Pleuronectes platessa]
MHVFQCSLVCISLVSKEQRQKVLSFNQRKLAAAQRQLDALAVTKSIRDDLCSRHFEKQEKKKFEQSDACLRVKTSMWSAEWEKWSPVIYHSHCDHMKTSNPSGAERCTLGHVQRGGEREEERERNHDDRPDDVHVQTFELVTRHKLSSSCVFTCKPLRAPTVQLGRRCPLSRGQEGERNSI